MPTTPLLATSRSMRFAASRLTSSRGMVRVRAAVVGSAQRQQWLAPALRSSGAARVTRAPPRWAPAPNVREAAWSLARPATTLAEPKTSDASAEQGLQPAFGAPPELQTAVLDVGNMKCGGCSAAVKRMLMAQPNIEVAAVNLLTESAAIQYRCAWLQCHLTC